MVDDFLKNTLEDTNAFSFDYFENMDLDNDLNELYKKMGNEYQYNKFKEQMNVSKLRSLNHKRYHDIDIFKLKNLPIEFNDLTDDIFSLYDYIDSSKILESTKYEADGTSKILDEIYKKLSVLNKLIVSFTAALNEENDKKQKKLNIQYIKSLNITEDLKECILEQYNELVIYNSVIVEDNYDNLMRQLKRREYIDKLYSLLYEKKNDVQEPDNRVLRLNDKLNTLIKKYKIKFRYLEDLMIENSKYQTELNDLQDFYNSIIAYDDTDYNNIKIAYDILSDEHKLGDIINSLEEMFIEERENSIKEEAFVYEKAGIKNIRKSLDYITANYMDKLDLESKEVIKHIYQKINNEINDINKIEEALSIIVRDIWNDSITSVYSYNEDSDYCFICTNNQFIDEKYEAILITKRMLQSVEDLCNYQVGFICGYNDNILYITENDDIMSVNYNDLSALKTPMHIEQELINFKVNNKIALNGYKTKIEAVYYIDTGVYSTYKKALELANMYKLPLIKLKYN